MSDENKWNSQKVVEQVEAHRDLSEEYTPEVANHLVSRSLQRHGVMMTPDQVDAWATINDAAGTGKLSIQNELARAEAKASHTADMIVGRVSGSQPPSPWAGHDHEEAAEQDEGWGEDIDDDDPEDERPSLSEIFGYDDDEDNEEAAYDHILKLSERDD